MSQKDISPEDAKKIRAVLSDPVLWAKAFVMAKDPATGKYGPWTARDYQAELLRNRDIRKAYRMGRRLGKTEIMCIDGLWQCFTHKNYRVLYITPYENQVNLIFMRMRELINDSPLIKQEIVKMKNSPYTIEFINGSSIMGFTTGASTGAAASSVRGQRGDWLFLDELDYMGDGDYGTVSAIANERSDIGVTVSSTPTGKRGIFWAICCKKELGYTCWHIPSQRSPLWTPEMEARARAEFTQQEYEHEVLAEFGTEEAGVFNKDCIDKAMNQLYYTYLPLDTLQKKMLEGKQKPLEFIFDQRKRAPQNLIRTAGVDFDKNKYLCI